jgi:hypothetical protein
MKRGRYALHFRATFGVLANVPFSFLAYLKSMSGRIKVPKYGIDARFEQMSVAQRPEFSIRGKLVSGDLRAKAYTGASGLKATLAGVEARLGFSFCGEPAEEDTIIQTEVPLRVHRGTGPLSQVK